MSTLVCRSAFGGLEHPATAMRSESELSSSYPLFEAPCESESLDRD